MSELRKAVLSIIEAQGNEEEQKVFMEDVMQYGCVSGHVSELVYYADTHAWFDKYYDDIMELKDDLEDSFGDAIEVKGDLKNFFAWLSFEETTRYIYEEMYGSY